MANNFYLYFPGKVIGLRVRRLAEAATSLGYRVSAMSFGDIIITDSCIYYKGEEISVGPSDISWICSNGMTAHEVARYYGRKGLIVWPGSKAHIYSDKFYASGFFTQIGVRTPKTVYLNPGKIAESARFVGGFPCVIKKIYSSEGKHVELVNNEAEVKYFIDSVYSKLGVGQNKTSRLSFILQEFIKDAGGADYRVTFLDGEIIGTVRRQAKEGFKANLSQGGSGEFVKTDVLLNEITKKIIKESGLFFGGIDFIKSGGNYYAIEINTSAQFEKFEKYLNEDIARKIIKALPKLRN